MKKFLSHSITEVFLGSLIILSVVLCIFTPDFELLQKGAEFTVHIMLSLLLLGMFFLVFDQRRLMLLSLGSVIILAIFLKGASNSNLKLPETDNAHSVSVAHVNVSNIGDQLESLKAKLIEDQIDIISFQEVTPDWHYLLKRELSDIYPNNHSMVRIDYYGMAVYSKKDIIEVDTIDINNIPNLEVVIQQEEDQNITILSSYMIPPLYNQIGQNRKAHFDLLSDRIESESKAYIVLGDFNLTYWSSEIRNFKQAANLENSRRDISESGFKVPHDHIFFSHHLDCTAFYQIRDLNTQLGIYGKYQFKSDDKAFGENFEYSSKVDLF